MPKRVRFYLPTTQERSLNEFVYTVVMNMSNQQRQGLPDHLRIHTSTQKRFHKFIEKSNTDQKRELLNHANLSSFLVIAPMGITGNKDCEEVITKFKNNDIQDGLRQAVKSNFFVSSDADLAFALGRLSQTMNGVPYIQNLELKRAAEAVRRWSKKLPVSDEVDDESIDLIHRILLWSGINWEQSASVVGLEADHLKMLFYLYTLRNRFTSKEKMDGFFAGIIPLQRMKGIYVILRNEMLIQHQYDNKNVGYVITKKGIRICNQFRDRVLKSINF